ncbi:unnamed protein product [Urochloa humidicola]
MEVDDSSSKLKMEASLVAVGVTVPAPLSAENITLRTEELAEGNVTCENKKSVVVDSMEVDVSDNKVNAATSPVAVEVTPTPVSKQLIE